MSSPFKIIPQPSEAGACSSAVAMNVHKPGDERYAGSFRGRAAMVTLGCAKNQVDSEVMLGVLRNHGYEIVTDLASADVAVVNTCGFLESSVKESIDAVLDAAEYKSTGRLRKLIVAGCMVERYKGDLRQTLPEVDSFLLTGDLLKVGEAADGGVGAALNDAGRPYFLYDDTMPRQLSTQRHTAYVKVAEGCNRPCTFCIIPKIRGAMRSRTIDSVVKEVVDLGAQGVREINLVAQDLTSYGKDLSQGSLPELLRALDGARAVDWIRLLYAYPIGIDEALLDSIVELPSVCNYLDLPLQHASEDVLRNMKRPLGRYSPRHVAEFIRTRAPQIVMRTTFIVGFPGETEKDVDELEAFIREGHFLNVGIFTYSPEEGTPSHDMKGHLSQQEKDARRERLMLAQQEVAGRSLSGYLGKRLPVLVEGAHEDTDLLLSGRAEFQAPEVDGVVIINDIEGEDSSIPIGTIREVEITEVSGYDLVGTVKSLS